MATDVNYESQRHREIWDKIKGGAGGGGSVSPFPGVAGGPGAGGAGGPGAACMGGAW